MHVNDLYIDSKSINNGQDSRFRLSESPPSDYVQKKEMSPYRSDNSLSFWSSDREVDVPNIFRISHKSNDSILDDIIPALPSSPREKRAHKNDKRDLTKKNQVTILKRNTKKNKTIQSSGTRKGWDNSVKVDSNLFNISSISDSGNQSLKTDGNKRKTKSEMSKIQSKCKEKQKSYTLMKTTKVKALKSTNVYDKGGIAKSDVELETEATIQKLLRNIQFRRTPDADTTNTAIDKLKDAHKVANYEFASSSAAKFNMDIISKPSSNLSNLRKLSKPRTTLTNNNKNNTSSPTRKIPHSTQTNSISFGLELEDIHQIDHEEKLLKERAAKLKADAARLNERKAAVKLENLREGLESLAMKELIEYRKILTSDSNLKLIDLKEQNKIKIDKLLTFQKQLLSKIKHLESLNEDLDVKLSVLVEGYKQCEIQLNKENALKVKERSEVLKDKIFIRMQEAAASLGFEINKTNL